MEKVLKKKKQSVEELEKTLTGLQEEREKISQELDVLNYNKQLLERQWIELTQQIYTVMDGIVALKWSEENKEKDEGK